MSPKSITPSTFELVHQPQTHHISSSKLTFFGSSNLPLQPNRSLNVNFNPSIEKIQASLPSCWVPESLPKLLRPLKWFIFVSKKVTLGWFKEKLVEEIGRVERDVCLSEREVTWEVKMMMMVRRRRMRRGGTWWWQWWLEEAASTWKCGKPERYWPLRCKMFLQQRE